MKINITINQEVESNINYISCEEGEFLPTDFVMCKCKDENEDNTVMFLAEQIKNIDNESSN
jgi:hypothetical protein